MDKTFHTKGKWVVDKHNNVCVGYEEIAFLKSSTKNKERRANALLISKAPEMLKELIKEVEILKSMGLGDTDRCERKEQLIKEATEL